MSFLPPVGAPRIAIGGMRLSTEPDRDRAPAIAAIHAALDAGVRLFDTADAYCWQDDERGHNERLIAEALAAWSGARASVRIATKGGLTRPGGRWVPDGRAKHLAAACEASCRALGVARLDLYQLHAPDPVTPFATSVRALAALQRRGLIEHIGLCNVTVQQIEEAQRIAEIGAVQIALSPWEDEAVLGGVVRHCIDRGIPLLAYRPLGGVSRRSRTAGDPVLAAIAGRHGVSPFDVAIAWALDLSPLIVPVVGTTRPESARSSGAAAAIVLDDDDRARLDERFPSGAIVRRGRAAAPRQDGDVVIVMGLPGAGKSTIASAMTEQGYRRLNRDEAKGSLRGLVPALDAALASGQTRIVLDNTYVTRKSRAEVIEAAAARGVSTRCVWLTTSVEDAQVNVAWRLIERYGALPAEEDLARLRRTDPGAFPPSVQFRYQRELEPPDAAEGFSRIDAIPFQRRIDPSFTNRAILVWCDGLLARSRAGHRAPSGPDDLVVDPAHGATLRRYAEQGWRVLGISWQPELSDGSRSRETVAATFARLRGELAVEIEIEVCPHAAGPPACWCRKPLPGLGVLFIARHRLDPATCIYVGDGPQDPGFARRLGFGYRRREFLDAVPRHPP